MELVCGVYSIKDKIEENTYLADHLERPQIHSNFQWRYPNPGDTQTILREQILDIEIKGK